MDQDILWDKLQGLMASTYKRIESDKPDRLQPQKFASNMIFVSLCELYFSYPKIVSSTIRASVLRSVVELYADTYAIFRSKDVDNSAQKYISSADTAFKRIAQRLPKLISATKTGNKKPSRPFRDLGRWNDVGITQRVFDTDNGRAVIHVYDYLCYFTHLSPARHILKQAIDDKTLRGWMMFYTWATIRKSLYNGLYTDEEIKHYNDLEVYFDTQAQ